MKFLIILFFYYHLVLKTSNVASAQGLQCYVCNSHFDAECNEESIPDRYLKLCSKETAFPIGPPIRYDLIYNWTLINRTIPTTKPDKIFNFCRKTVFEIPEQQNEDCKKKGTTRIVRSCGYEEKTISDICRRRSQRSGIRVEMCQCNGNECNFGPETNPIPTSRTIQVMMTVHLLRHVLLAYQQSF